MASRSKVRILRVLIRNPGRDFCLDDIVKETGSSFGTIHPSIKDLVSARAVLVRKVGKTKLYRMNEKNPLYPKLRELFKKEKSMLWDVAKEFVLKLDKKNIKSIILFGSVARGDITEKSDIDLLFVTDHRSEVKRAVSRLAHRFLECYDVEVVPTYLTEKEFRERKAKFDKFITAVIKEGKKLFGD